MTPYQFGQHIKQAIDMTSPEYAKRMKAYTGQLRSQGIKNIQFGPDGNTIIGINTNKLGFTPRAPQAKPTATPAAAPTPRPIAPAPNRPVVQRSRSAF
jgi:hypothetical protein